MYYFPESSKPMSKFGFMACIECNLTMVEYHKPLCEQLKKEGLPCVDYRISSDYGSLIMMKSNNSSAMDMIGPPLNMCSKINHSASKNGIVIEGDLHYMIKGFHDYKFTEKEGLSLRFKHSYPVYAVERR